ncbi:CarD family transcriptional regulator [Slackia heliotrinireducens]|uniref:CarD family transcriptional regulator n=1 Tax=Slackia heliotrinireducens TaxID=84110 RepID=UPI003315D283
MYQVDDKVIYANYGVCIVKETNAHISMMGNEDRPYYILAATRDKGGKIYVPMDKEDALRPVMNAEDARALIDSFEGIETDDFKDSNSRTVEDHFKKMLRTNDIRLALKVAKTMRKRIREQEAKRHIPSSMYTRLYDQATHQVRSEVSAALEIDEAEVDAILKSHDLDIESQAEN